MIDPPPIQDDVLNALETARDQLEAYATREAYDGAVYTAARKTLLGHPGLSTRLPDVLKAHRKIESTWPTFKEFGTYAERRAWLASIFDPLLTELEQAVAVTDQRFDWPEHPIDQGGFSLVYKVTHKLTGMDFAMKLFAPAFAEGGEGHLDRFFREARILFSLRHPNIIRVFDVGMLGRRPYIQMEFFEGPSLRRHIKDYGRIPAARALWLVREVAGALDHAHVDVGVVHRDICPRNILVGRMGDVSNVKVIDFGLGVFIEQELISRITRTGQGVIAGPYTAPELRQDPKLLDPRSDVYSLGIVWFEMLVGRTPAAGSFMEELSAAGVPSTHTAVLHGCLKADGRVSSMRELLNLTAQL